jgi:3-hydroxyisobutyrate dehydrogenase
MAKIAFIGLGVMGGPIARHLAAAGHELTVYNRTHAKAEEWVAAHGGRAAPTPAEAAEGQDAVLSCVGQDENLHAVTLGPEGAFAVMKSGSLFVDHTTVSAEIARQLDAEATARGFHSVDAPVSGGQAGAENGQLSIMCGGSDAAMAVATPIMQPYAKRIVHIGAPGAGQIAKMVNQIAIAGVVQGISEGLRFAQAAKVDLDKVFEAISGGAAQSWQMENRWKTMRDDKFDFGFAIDWMRKDLALTLDEARLNGAPLPVTGLIDQFYGDVVAMGGGRQDTSALVRRLRK